MFLAIVYRNSVDKQPAAKRSVAIAINAQIAHNSDAGE